MGSILYMSDDGLDARGRLLARIAASRGWTCADAAGSGGALAVLGAGWEPGDLPGLAAVRADEFRLADARRLSSRDGWIRLVNGRYALAFDERLLREAVADADADAIEVSVEGELTAYLEKVIANREGRVLGFKRAYRDEHAPAGRGENGWQMLLVKEGSGGPEAVATEGDPGRAPQRLRAEGKRVAAVAVAGEACDLASESGALRFLRAHARRRIEGEIAAGARVIGEVTVEAGALVGPDAVIIGPALVCAGASIGKGATVSSAIIGPGAAVGDQCVVRGAVVLAGYAGGAEGAAAGTAARVKAHAFREWPFFSYARLGKRLLDIAGSIVALAVLVTIFPITAVAIKLNSRGRIFYAHRRQGLRGREFSCLKFRTMRAEAGVTREELRAINEVDGPQFKVEHDPRTTLVGEFLRETNIDEIPQFLNVLAGHMSIVGPRPSPDEENQMCPAWREARLSVRPGITGLWQVSRSADRRNDFQEWIHYDTEYVRTLSFRNDLVIIAKTVKVILSGFAQLFVVKREAGNAAQGRTDATEPDGRQDTGVRG